MASIPCAAYQATSIHCHLRRQRFKMSCQGDSSTDMSQSQPGSASQSPAPQSADAAKHNQNFFGQLSEKVSWMWHSQENKRPGLQTAVSTDSNSSR